MSTCRRKKCISPERAIFPQIAGFFFARSLFLCSQELEENVEYKEKEDEFDVVVDSGDPEGHKRQAEKAQEEETTVCIEAIDTVSAAESARPDQLTTLVLLVLSSWL